MKRNTYFLAALALLMFSSCSKFLQEDNKSNTTADNFYATADGYDALVNSCYSSLRDIFGGVSVSSSGSGSMNGIPEIFCGGTDLFQLYLPSTVPSSNNKGLETYQALTPSDGVVTSFYADLYTAIKRCNDAIHYGTGQSAVRVAEVRFLRALFYFQLVQQFGDVALVTDYLSSPVSSYPRTPAKDIYSFIISEMESVLPTLPASGDPGRVSQRVANHYLALVYLTRGYDTNLGGSSSDFEKSISYATSAIAGQPLTLDLEKEVFWPGQDNNSEVLFSVQYSLATLASTSAGNAQGSYFGAYLGGSDASIGDGIPYMNSIFRPTKRLYQLMTEDPNDTRFAKTFMQTLYGTGITKLSYYSYFTTTPKISNVVIYYPAPGTTESAVNAWIAADPANRSNAIIQYADDGDGSFSNWLSLNNSMPVYPCIKKFASPGTIFGTTSSVRNIFLARLAETYLIRAEAEVKSGDAQDAAADINIVRARSSASPIIYSQATIDYILDERARELAGEYHRWFDLKRTGMLTTYVPQYNPDVTNQSFMQGNDGQYKLLRPIPQNAINLNGTTVTQNPGY